MKPVKTHWYVKVVSSEGEESDWQFKVDDRAPWRIKDYYHPHENYSLEELREHITDDEIDKWFTKRTEYEYIVSCSLEVQSTKGPVKKTAYGGEFIFGNENVFREFKQYLDEYNGIELEND